MIKSSTVRGLVLGLVLMLTGSCMAADGEQPPPGQDWFGNPIPTGPACDARPPVPRERPLYDPAKGGRPAVVPEGWSWMVVTIKLRAIWIDPKTQRFNFNHCVPVGTHVYATQAFNPAPLKMNTGTGAVTLLPFDGVVTTPWLTSYFIFAYNPIGWRNGPPPEYKIDFISTWDSRFDTTGVEHPHEIVCHIGIGQGFEVVEGRSVPKRERLTATCKYQSHQYWTF